MKKATKWKETGRENCWSSIWYVSTYFTYIPYIILTTLTNSIFGYIIHSSWIFPNMASPGYMLMKWYSQGRPCQAYFISLSPWTWQEVVRAEVLSEDSRAWCWAPEKVKMMLVLCVRVWNRLQVSTGGRKLTLCLGGKFFLFFIYDCCWDLENCLTEL